jgi:hypothetical protein
MTQTWHPPGPQLWNGQTVFHVCARFNRQEVLSAVIEAVRFNPAGPEKWQKLLRWVQSRPHSCIESLASLCAICVPFHVVGLTRAPRVPHRFGHSTDAIIRSLVNVQVRGCGCTAQGALGTGLARQNSRESLMSIRCNSDEWPDARAQPCPPMACCNLPSITPKSDLPCRMLAAGRRCTWPASTATWRWSRSCSSWAPRSGAGTSWVRAAQPGIPRAASTRLRHTQPLRGPRPTHPAALL